MMKPLLWYFAILSKTLVTSTKPVAEKSQENGSLYCFQKKQQ